MKIELSNTGYLLLREQDSIMKVVNYTFPPFKVQNCILQK